MRAGYAQTEPPVLQPAEPFLDLSGEDIRRRMFLTSDPEGRELCLRPDLTIPVSRDYLASPEAGKAVGFCYLGAVFRHREGAAAEFVQAGIESFGRADKAAADAEMLALGLEATTHYGLNAPEIRMGDVGLFSAFVAALDLAPVWKRRLVKDFNRKTSLAHDLDQITLSSANGAPEYQGVLAALSNSDPKAAHHLVTDLLSIAGIAAVGGRSVAEIADRFLEQAALNAPTRLPRETRALIERFLAVARRSRRSGGRTAHAREPTPRSRSGPRSICSRPAPDFSPRAASMCAPSNSRPASAAVSTITPASCSSCTTRAAKARSSPAAAMTGCCRGSAPARRSRRSALPLRSKS